jgi:hypothetical protein
MPSHASGDLRDQTITVTHRPSHHARRFAFVANGIDYFAEPPNTRDGECTQPIEIGCVSA